MRSVDRIFRPISAAMQTIDVANTKVVGRKFAEVGRAVLGGQAADLDIQTREILRTRGLLNQILADRTGQPLAKVERDVDRDYIMDARQALEYGMIDRIIASRELTPVPTR